LKARPKWLRALGNTGEGEGAFVVDGAHKEAQAVWLALRNGLI